MRPSPERSATAFEPGTRRAGNDGWMYHVVQDRSGKRRWQLTPESAAMRKEWGRGTSVTFSLKPSVRQLDEEKDDATNVSATATAYLKRMRIPSFSGDRALQIVWTSLPMPLTKPPRFYAKSVKWDVKRKLYDVEFVFRVADEARDFVRTELRDNYGELAADTWMEGDIRITKDHEMDLELQDAAVKPSKQKREF